MTTRKFVVFVFFGSVTINAFLGIIALVVGDFGDTQGKVLLTSLSVSAASVLSLAMFPARVRGHLAGIPNIGIGLSITGFALLIIVIWFESGEELLWKVTASVLIFAIAAGHSCLISLFVLQPRYFNVSKIAYCLVGLLSVLIVGAIWSEPGGEIFPRILGVLSILIAAATVSIPVLHRLTRTNEDVRRTTAVLSRDPTRVFMENLPTICLVCGQKWIADYDSDIFKCSACDAFFEVEIRG
ncbi:MAG: hypothetical protein VYC65_03590 [Chloroflexota bacterium]|nr:hypothetical protein [Chloroflexota bacterium]